jgi:hypothetical protein
MTGWSNKAVEGTGPGVSGCEFSGIIKFSVSWRDRGPPVPHLDR